MLSFGFVVFAALLVYANSLGNGFVWDDHAMIVENAFVADPANLRHLLDPRYYSGGHAVLAGTRPVFLASLLLDRGLWGLHPAGYHLTNVFLHAANAGWVYLLAASLLTGFAPLLAGLVFALHPIATEAVNGVSFRSDLLAAFFMFAGLWTYLRARKAAWKPAALLLAASAACYGLGLLSKEMAATLPLLTLLAEWYLPAGSYRRRFPAVALAAYATVALAYAGFWAPRFRYAGLAEGTALRAGLDQVAKSLYGGPAPGTLPIQGPSRTRVFAPSPPPWAELSRNRRQWFWTMSKVFAGYFQWLVYPGTLVADRAPRLAAGWKDPGAAAAALALAALALLAGFLLRRRHPAGFGLSWCFLTLLPVSGLLPLYNPVAERYLYIVSVGFAWALAAVAGAPARGARELPFSTPAVPRASFALARGARLIAGLAFCLLLGYAARTHARNRDWESDTTLFLRAPPAELSPRALYTRAFLLRKQGNEAAADRELEEAVRRHPGFAEAWLALGAAHSQSNRNAEALACLQKAFTLAPGNPVMSFGLGDFLAKTGQPTLAIAAYRASLAAEPAYLEAWVNLAALHRDLGEYGKARACYDRAISLAGPDPVPYFSYGLLLDKMGRRREASKLYAAALARQPGYGPARAALARLKGGALQGSPSGD